MSEAVFHFGDELRPSLRELVRETAAGETSTALLALIGEPDDLKMIVAAPPRPQRRVFADRWTSSIASALFEPTSDEEWSFLEKCASNGFVDPWADTSAIRTLKLIASARSKTILLRAQARNPNRSSSLRRALEYIDAQPISLSGADLSSLAGRVAQVVKVGDWKGSSAARCDQTFSNSLVDFTFEAGVDRYVYTATFHKSEGLWKVRGVRFTMQALIMRPGLLPGRVQR